jgi:5'-nucleotidase
MGEVIVSTKDFDDIKARILSEGVENLHVIADFDKTLTRAFVNGEATPSIISELRNRNILSEEYSVEAKRLYEEFHPFEIDHTIEEIVRDAKMNEWWTKVFDLLKKEGLNKSHLNDVIKFGNVQLRDGVEDFLRFLRDHYVPLVILSASGIGDLIPMFLESKGLLYQNITVVSNFFDWDDEGNMKCHLGPIIHSENKGEAGIEKFSVYEKLLGRRNVLLLGDSLGDVEMIGKFPYDNLVRFGFLNEKIDERREEYEKRYDCVVIGDGDFEFVNEFLFSFGSICSFWK